MYKPHTHLLQLINKVTLSELGLRGVYQSVLDNLPPATSLVLSLTTPRKDNELRWLLWQLITRQLWFWCLARPSLWLYKSKGGLNHNNDSVYLSLNSFLPSRSFEFMGNAVFPVIVSKICVNIPSIFAAGNPRHFQQVFACPFSLSVISTIKGQSK